MTCILNFHDFAASITFPECGLCRSRWPCGLRRRSAAPWLLGSRARNPLRAWMFVCCVVCCVRCGQCDGLITRSEASCQVCVSVCELETSKTRRPRPNLGCFATEERSVTCRASPNFLASSATDCNILHIPAVKFREIHVFVPQRLSTQDTANFTTSDLYWVDWSD
jgi:hypothetical protein